MNGKVKIDNTQFGLIEIESKEIITFPEGLLGFEDIKRFTILTLKEYEPFQWLVAVDDKELTFPIVSPVLVIPDYAPSITRDQTESIGNFGENDLLMYLIVSINPEGKKATANLRGPVLINLKTKKGIQIVLEDELSTDHQFI